MLILNLVMTDNANVYLKRQSGYIDDSAWAVRPAELTFFTKLTIYEQWRRSAGSRLHDPGFLAIINDET